MTDILRRSLIRCGLTLAGMLVLLVLLFRQFAYARDAARRTGCQSNLRQIMLGIQQYTKDYDARLPLAKVSDRSSGKSPFDPAYGWADGLQPYLKSVCIFQCPSESFSPDAEGKSTSGGFTDYWYNSNLSGQSPKGMRRANVVSLGDGVGNAQGTARYALNAPPDQKVFKSPYGGEISAWHHLNGANFAFADGHVKWLLPADVSVQPGAQYTFSTR